MADLNSKNNENKMQQTSVVEENINKDKTDTKEAPKDPPKGTGTSGAARRRELWAKYEEEKAEAERLGLPLPERPPPRKAYSQQQRMAKGEAGARTRLPVTKPAVESEKRKPEKSVSDPTLKPDYKKQRSEAPKSGKSRPTGQGHTSVLNKGPTFASLAANKPRVNLALREVLGQLVSTEEVDAFKCALEDAILEIPDGEKVPCFLDTMVRQGMITVICEDKHSEDWLRENAPKWKAGESSVRLVAPEELTKRVKLTVLFPPPKRDTEKAKLLLAKQNVGLETSGWIVHNKSELPSGTLLVFGVDEPSANLLKKWGYKAFLGSGHVIFRPVKRTTDGPEEREEMDTQTPEVRESMEVS